MLTGVPPDSAMNMEEVVFDPDFYHNRYPDLQKAFNHDNARLHKHWHEYGIGEGRTCSAVLDLKFYLNRYPDLQKAFGTDYKKVYKHFFEYGIKELRQSSALYDPKAYKSFYPWLANLTPNQLLWHFKNQGYPQGLMATMGFATVTYTAGSNMEDLVFDPNFYHNKYPDLQKAFNHDNARLYKHWHEYGIGEGRTCSEVLDLKFYLNRYPDLQKAFGTDYKKLYKHFFEYGIKELRQSSATYDPKIYQARYGLQALNGQQLLQHYMCYGRQHYMWAY